MGWGSAFAHCEHQAFRRAGVASARGGATWRGEGQLMVGAGLTARAWAEPAGDLPDEPTNGVSSWYGIGAPFSPGW